MKTILQIRYQSWEKDERGGLFAQKRSRFPKERELPINELLEVKEGIFIDHICEVKRVRNQTLNDYLKIDDLSFLPTDSGLEVRNLQIQKPNGDHKLIHNLQPNSWFRVLYNRKHVDTNRGEYSRWWYESNLINIGFYSTLHKNIFIDEQPKMVVDLREDLYKLGKAYK